MKYTIGIFILISLLSCNTLDFGNDVYRESSSAVELASIGFSKSKISGNDFSIHSFPKIDNKLRTEVKIVPFNKELNKLYQKKSRLNQNQAKISYIDSLTTKPELVTITILDIAGLVREINSNTNEGIREFLKNSEEARIVTSIVTTLPQESLSKIRQADTYYLLNSQESKASLVLYKSQKKVETIDLQAGILLAHGLSKCCWALDPKGTWYLSDFISEEDACQGNTSSRIKKKETYKTLDKL